jgi:hypothetical protein
MVEQIVAGVATPDLEALLHEAEAGDGPEAGTR